MRNLCAALVISLATMPQAKADVRSAVEEVVLPSYQKFAKSAEKLADKSQPTCDIQALRPDYQTAYDDWLAIGFLHIGPSEEAGRSLAIHFWPDPKGLGAKAQRALLLGDAAILSAESFAKQSVAARGLPALERLLYPEAGTLDADGNDPCPLLRATTRDMARLANEIATAWEGDQGFAALLLSAGMEGNSRYLTEREARQALFTQLMSGLEFTADQRLGRPLGTFDRPRPERAEAKASQRSQRNVAVSLRALRAYADALEPEAKQTLAAFDRAISLAEALDDPIFGGVSEPEKRLKIEILQQSVKAVQAVALSEMAAKLQVDLGFNSQDGD